MGLPKKFASMGGTGGDTSALLPKAMSMDFLKLWTGARMFQINWPADTVNGGTLAAVVATVTGSGQVNSNGYACMVRSQGTSGSRARCKIPGGAFEGLGLAALDSEDWRRVDWTSPMVIQIPFSIFAATTNGQSWVKVGNGADSNGDLTVAGLQFRVDNLTLVCGAHNGTSLDEADGVALSAISRQHEITIVGDGAGDFEFYLDGVLLDTLAGPAASVGFDNRIAAESTNGADSADQGIIVMPIKIGLMP